jgi:hypothetical protein
VCFGGSQNAQTPGAPPAPAATGADALKIGTGPSNERTNGIGRLFLRLTGQGGGSDNQNKGG